MNISAKEFENEVEAESSFSHRGQASSPVASSRQRRTFSRRRKGPQHEREPGASENPSALLRHRLHGVSTG